MKCQTCITGYGLPSTTDQSKCDKCQQDCVQCTTVTNCTRCFSNSTTVLGPKKDGSGTCGPCASNCRSCVTSGAGLCNSCSSGYSLQANGTCAACTVEYCATCSNGTCTSCKGGYSLNTSTQKCVPCGNNCTFCVQNPGQCDPGYCQSGFTFVNGSNTCVPTTTLAPGSTVSQTAGPNGTTPAMNTTGSQATPAPTGSAGPNGTTPAMNTTGSIATPAPTGSAGPNGTSPPTQASTTPACIMPDCLTCVPGPPKTCSQCRPGFGTPSPTNQTSCQKCSLRTGCAQCTTLTLCTKCTSTTMAPKTDGSGECAPCASNCRTCTTKGPGKCDSCNTGYYLLADSTCGACTVTNCQTCNATQCISCKTGYYLNTTTKPETCAACGSFCTFCNQNPGQCDPKFCQKGYDFVNGSNTCVASTTAASAATTQPMSNVSATAGTAPPSNTTNTAPPSNTTGTAPPPTGTAPTPTNGTAPPPSNETAPSPATGTASPLNTGATTPANTSNSCPDMSFCASCPNDPLVCETCTGEPGKYGKRTSGPGCAYCSPTGSYCVSCTMANKCDECEIGYGPVIGSETTQCQTCATDCYNCSQSGSGKCDSGGCLAGGYDPSTGSCQPCAQNCPGCSANGAGSCDTCPTGQGFTDPTVTNPTAPGACDVCTVPDCMNCYGDRTKCELCNSGNGPDPATGACTAAAAAVVDDDNPESPQTIYGACKLPNCETCVMGRSPKCKKCQVGYGTPSETDESSCVPCNRNNSGCLNCDSLSQCTLCKSSGMAPKKDGSGECAACAPNCIRCSEPGHCDSCEAGYSLKSDGTCAACNVENCDMCEPGYCTNCKAGYWLNTATNPPTCQACGRDCMFCNKNPGQCDPGYCNNGFTFDSATNSCKFPEAVVVEGSSSAPGAGYTMSAGGGKDSGKLIGIIVGCSVGGFLLAALLACCCCMRPSSAPRPIPVSDFAPRSSYQIPTDQRRPWFSSYGDMQTSVEPQRVNSYFQKPPFENDYATRYQPYLGGGRF